VSGPLQDVDARGEWAVAERLRDELVQPAPFERTQVVIQNLGDERVGELIPAHRDAGDNPSPAQGVEGSLDGLPVHVRHGLERADVVQVHAPEG
jgi:hypothetical protein